MAPLPLIQDRKELEASTEEALAFKRNNFQAVEKQKLSPFLRWPIRFLFLPFVLLDLSAQRAAKWIVRPPFIRAGSCKRRGACCQYILMEEPKNIFGKLYKWWNTEVNGFFIRENEPQYYGKKRIRVMGCRYLQADGKCKHYWLRPQVCRTWPIIEHFGKPRVLKGCGYYLVKKQRRQQGE